MKTLIIYLLMASVVFATDWDALSGFRDWRSDDGKVFKAKLVSLTPTGCRLKGHRDGRTREVSLGRLADTEVRLIQDAREGLREGKPQTKEAFWNMALIFGEYDKLVAKIPEDGSIVSLVPRRLNRESGKSIIITGDHVAVRIVTQDEDTTLQVAGDKVQAMKKTKVRTKRSEYTYYGYYWRYDTRTSVYRTDLCNKGTIFAPSRGATNPYKLLNVGSETIGVGKYLVFSLQLK